MNRENRRHPKHPILPDLPVSDKRILDDVRSKTQVNSKSNSSYKKTRKKTS